MGSSPITTIQYSIYNIYIVISKNIEMPKHLYDLLGRVIVIQVPSPN